jgi:hypothetical protein
MTPEIIAFSTRAIVVILTTLAAIMCIYLGWRLYFEAIKVKGRIDIEAGPLKVSMTTAAPGLFFALFGAGLLLFVLQSRVEYQEEETIEQAPEESAETNQTSAALRAPWVPDPMPSASAEQEGMLAVANKTPRNRAKPQCIYNHTKKKTLKHFDASDLRSEGEKIVSAFDHALPILAQQISRDPNDLELQRAYLVLEETREGFTQ